MKKFILWLIKVFKVDIPKETIIEKVVEREVFLPQDGIIEGNITIKGNVLIKGDVKVEGSLTISKEV